MVTIYALLFPDKSIYIGATSDPEGREKSHRFHMRRGKHNAAVLAKYSIYGDFRMVEIQHCTPQKQRFWEQHWIDRVPKERRLNAQRASDKSPQPVINVTTGIIYENVEKAARILGISAQGIRGCVTGHNKTFLGHVWQRPGDPPRDLTRKLQTLPKRKPQLSDAVKAHRAQATSKAHSRAVRNLTTGKTFFSQTLAAKTYGVSREAIRDAVSGRLKTAGGCAWERMQPKRTGKYAPPAHRKPSKARCLPVIRCDSGQQFESATAAAKAIGVKRASVVDALHGRSKTCDGSAWRFARPAKR